MAQAAAKKTEAAKKKGKVHSKRWSHYAIKGDKLERKNRFCPKCGEGNFMGEHKNRRACGKCGYTEIISSK
ncbi:30S ribosomal protein S27ae [Candidatus Woesearchaeota archaeon]|nr:30S ribosomal protein S27ae [Candidatus Woesearchaeota archaeon]